MSDTRPPQLVDLHLPTRPLNTKSQVSVGKRNPARREVCRWALGEIGPGVDH